MLFNSYEFLCFFFPLTCALFFVLCARGWARAAAGWLGLMSIVFYGYWSPRYVLLLLASIVVNFFLGQLLLKCRAGESRLQAKHVLIVAIAANLATLAYFKYANFFVDSFRAASGLDLQLAPIVLPIGISFFTFTQIAFLADTYQGKVREARFMPYLLFVSYFPHLIAGPVLHHAEMMPQFGRAQTFRFRIDNVVSGMTLLGIGLLKKVILADGIQPFVAPAFDGSAAQVLTGFEAWGAVLAYSLQLYFDFSGYSDMAIGLSRVFNVELPLNFASPYKARNISEFWRRWHMTLSRFLRDYLYFPLGGNRRGKTRRYVNLMITMLLGGLWHGAGWTFVIWGGLHGLYLVINHAWQAAMERIAGSSRWLDSRFATLAGVLVTFAAVTVAWTFFRATSLDAALRMLAAMSGANGWVLPAEWKGALDATLGVAARGLRFDDLTAFAGLRQVGWIAALLALAWFCPNSQEIMAALGRVRRLDVRIRATLGWSAFGALAASVMLLAIVSASRGTSEFIYFNF
jgi:D-alanyl-lipoteichoic acid acyltransferase DltB (MBOAT superfamily)